MPTRFLIIEDNPANLDLMAYLLESFGYEIVGAVSAELALEAVEQHSFDLIICDVQLPGIDGYEFVRRFKKDARWKHTPVVAVTALAMVGDQEMIVGAGFDGYLSKPIAPDKFVSKLEDFLPAEKRMDARPVAPPPLPGAANDQGERKGRILMVDDRTENLNVMKSILEPSGYEILTAQSGNEACRLLRGYRPDLIISDMHMPGEPDFEFVQRVKGSEEWRSIPFLFVSSTTNKERLRQQALRLGAAKFLFRPIDPMRLLGEIEEVLLSNEPVPS